MHDLPYFYKVKQTYPNEKIENIKETVFVELDKLLKESKLPKGSTIAITAGSRGIHQVATIFKYIVEKLIKEEFSPFIFSAMGSHGGGEAEGQKELLVSLGVTEEYVGAKISCSSEIVNIGETDEFLPGLAIYTASEALTADSILIVNRIKPHTNFRGDFESGIMKMMSVGMGRATGAAMVHKLGTENLLGAIKAIGKGVLNKLPILGAIAIVENAYEQTAIIEGITADKIMIREPELLKLAKDLMPAIPFKELDLLVVQQIGKNFSGTGMDTNIIGRIRINGVPEPDDFRIKYIGALSLSEESHGNATGVGLADFTTKRLVEKIDYQKTYTNVLTSGNVMRVAIPMITENDQDLLLNVIKALKIENASALKILMIKNTLHVNDFWISEGLVSKIKEIRDLEIESGPAPLLFDEYQNIILQD